ncbi:MAG: hypothetical protein IPN19_02025 [Elusimicrobia bacterium]|nr:hypothetical protein [Elusimicrobiota bacterium]
MALYSSFLMTGIIGIFLGLGLFILGMWLRMSAQKYEFNNISDGGVVRFDSFWAMKGHNMKKIVSGLILVVSFFVLVFGASVFAGSQLLKHQHKLEAKSKNQ